MHAYAYAYHQCINNILADGGGKEGAASADAAEGGSCTSSRGGRTADLSGHRRVQVLKICLLHFLSTDPKKCASFIATCHGSQVLEVYSAKALLPSLLTG